MERLEEFLRSIVAKDREKEMQMQELSSQSEVNMLNLQYLTHKYNDVVTKLNDQLGQVKVLKDDKKEAGGKYTNHYK